jgi:hypothetical protein
MIQSLQNNIICSIYPKFISGYSNIIKAANSNPGSQLNPADLVNIVGTVVSIPKRITTDKWGYQGYSTKDIQVEDKLIFSYTIVYNLEEVEFSDVPLYKNMFWYQGKEYWKVDIQQAFAVIRDNEIIMLNGYCMVEDMDVEAKIYLPQYLQRIAKTGSGILSHIGNPLEHKEKITAKQGERIYYNPNLLQRYQIKDNKFGIIRQDQIFCAEVETV